MRVSIIGSGYVGLVTAVCLAEKGNFVICVDLDKEKVKAINSGKAPIYEPGLEKLLKKLVSKGCLQATTSIKDAVLNSEISFICVGTPSREDGSIDLRHIKSASKLIGSALKGKKDYHLIVIKSTVIPKTTEKVVIPILEKESSKRSGEDFGVCVNPEFLREGSALHDFMFPKHTGIVIGELDERSGNMLVELYKEFDADVLRTSLRTAELIKYARNAYLAKDISFANEIANICERFGVDYLKVKKGMELDYRIGKGRFLNAGAGFGGSCFKKDLQALIAAAREKGYEPILLSSTLIINEKQPKRMIEIAESVMKELKDKKVGILGLAFKPGTDDIREAPSLKVINELLERGASVIAFDPRANERVKRIFGGRLEYASNVYEVLRKSDCCMILTEWPEFLKVYEMANNMKNKVIIDGRRLLDASKSKKLGISYFGIGYPGEEK
jgi:UDPglucose 6-dehydrogenase